MVWSAKCGVPALGAKFLGCAGALTSRENHSLFATRYSPFAAVLARQEPRPPNLSTDSKSVSKVTKPAKAGYQNWRAHILTR